MGGGGAVPAEELARLIKAEGETRQMTSEQDADLRYMEPASGGHLT